MANIRPKDLPAAASVPANSALVIDNGVSVEKATPLQVVDTARPLASQADAETGADNVKLMSPLRVKQAVDVYRTELAEAGGADLVGSQLDATGAVARSVQDKLNDTLSPMDFGAEGEAGADDGPALNAMFDHIRDLLGVDSTRAIDVNGGNRRYRTTESINMTGLAAWSLAVKDLHIIGECTGKAVIDLIGTRGYSFQNVTVWGGKTNRPSVGVQAQRGTPSGFCDNASFKDCNLDGWFSTAAVHDYGQETTQWDHCTIFNRDHTARVAIHTGYSNVPMTSDYASVMTGGTSFINKQFLNCDWRYLPSDENIATITNITNAAAAVVTAPGNEFEIGDQFVFAYVVGMPALPFAIATVTAKAGDNLTTNIDTTAMGTYGGGGLALRRAVQSPLYIARTEGFSTDSCYVVSYGQPHIEFGFPDPGFQRLEQIGLDKILFEGSGNVSAAKFTKTGAVTVQGFTLTTYNATTVASLLSSSGAGLVSFFKPRIESVDVGNANALVDAPASFAAYGADIVYPSLALVAPDTWPAFNGDITSIATGLTTTVLGSGVSLDGTFDGVAPVGSDTRYLNVFIYGANYTIALKSRT